MAVRYLNNTTSTLASKHFALKQVYPDRYRVTGDHTIRAALLQVATSYHFCATERVTDMQKAYARKCNTNYAKKCHYKPFKTL